MNCKIVKDLLPLYHDEVLSEESRELVEEHLQTCTECKKILEDIHENVKSAGALDVEQQMQNGFKSLKKRLHRKTVEKIFASIICAVVILSALIYGAAFYEMPAPYSDIKQTITEKIKSASDFVINAAGHKSMAVVQYGDSLYVSFSDTFWTRHIAKPSSPAKISFMGYYTNSAAEPPEVPEPPEMPEVPEVPDIGASISIFDSEAPEPPETPDPPEPPESPNILALIGESKKIYYVESDLSQISNELAFLITVKDAVLLWEH